MLRLLFTLAIGTWLGAIVSLTYIVTPTAHGTFDPRDARRLLRPLFPRHYTLGIACGFVALLTILVGKASLSPRASAPARATDRGRPRLHGRRTSGAAAEAPRARSERSALRVAASDLGDAEHDDARRAGARHGRRGDALMY
jgi:hypothetical protein